MTTGTIATWAYRLILFLVLFGLSPLAYLGNFNNPLLNILSNLSPIFGLGFFVVCFLRYPMYYRVIGWLLLIGVVLLLLESKYQYGLFVYSYFVIKRFAYCGVALIAYYACSRTGTLKIKYAVNLILGFFVINQLLLGQIFSYNFTSDTRTTLSPDALYLVIPFLYYLVLFLKEHRLRYLLFSLLILTVIIILLHRTVISAGVIAAVFMFVLALLGKVTTNRLPVGRTLITFLTIVVLATPFTGMLPESQLTSFMESIGGIFDPKEDNTGSWRMEQADYYMSQIPERPLFGWRYDGYDKGEIMENEDFPEKGTIIHSQYVDMLFNYGAFGLFINLALILGALVVLYRSGQPMSIDNLVLFGFMVSALIFAISYQLPIYMWGFVGVGMYYGLHPPVEYFTIDEDQDQDVDNYDSSLVF